MKNTILILSILMLSLTYSYAQKFGYFESQKILDKMPEFQKANEEIDAQVEIWKKEVDTKFEEVDTKYNYYVENEDNLNESARQQKQQEIIDAEKAANELKKEVFGYDGKVQKLKSEKIDPIMDKVTNSVEKVALENSYDFIFEKSTETQWVVTNDKYNITSLILEDLGL